MICIKKTSLRLITLLELICASNLISYEYSVEVEKTISDILVCDVFATRGNETMIIEIETGFTPPEHALDSVDYYSARIISKIARYSHFCTKFALATPVIGLLPIPKLFFTPPSGRTENQINKIKSFCDRFYKNPPIGYGDILDARLHSVYLINTDKGFAKELVPTEYVKLSEKLFKKSEVGI